MFSAGLNNLHAKENAKNCGFGNSIHIDANLVCKHSTAATGRRHLVIEGASI